MKSFVGALLLALGAVHPSNALVASNAAGVRRVASISGGATGSERGPAPLHAATLSTSTQASNAEAGASSPRAQKAAAKDAYADALMADLREKYAHQPTFLQAVEECAEALGPLLEGDSIEADRHRRALTALVEPERTIGFRVAWRDRDGVVRQNRAWRVQFSSALGPYKGGLRFHPSVDEGVLKFLGFEQIFKNALTGLGMGAGKGGSDFDPRGKTDAEVHAFCEAFMRELVRHIGEHTDVPAGDINVGGREIGYLYGAYKKLANRDASVLTGKGALWGGSLLRPEATGYGAVYFGLEALQGERGHGYDGLRCVVSGSGNVAQYAAEKLMDLGASVLSLSDSAGAIYKEAGLTRDDLAAIMAAKNVDRARLSALDIDGAAYVAGSVWHTLEASVGGRVDAAFPCATQNEVDADGARALVDKGCFGVFEGANMPCERDAIAVFKEHRVVYGPGKAANAGGVGVSGLEMAQNAARDKWSSKTVDDKLRGLMASIYSDCVAAAPPKTSASDMTDLEKGANCAGFVKVADAMDQLGWI